MFIPGISQGDPNGMYKTPKYIAQYAANPQSFSASDLPNLLGDMSGLFPGGGAAGGGSTGLNPVPGQTMPQPIPQTLPLYDIGSKNTFSNLYKPPEMNSDNLFQDYLSKIMAPSSVDQVRSGIESDQMKENLAQIDRDTAGSIANTKLDALDRGIGGPGQNSDIEANAVAQLQAGGNRTKAAERSKLALSELDRQKAREEATRTAYGARYGAGVASDTQNKSIAASGAQKIGRAHV